MSLLERLTAQAFAQCPARDANEAIAQIRARMEAEHGDAVNYEVALAGRGDSHLLQVVGPRLALYLRSKRYRVTACAPGFLSLFEHDTLYFIAAPVFYEALRDEAGWTPEAFAEIARGWEETGRWALAALPGAGGAT